MEDHKVRFNAGLASVRRAAALIVGQPFGASKSSQQQLDIDATLWGIFEGKGDNRVDEAGKLLEHVQKEESVEVEDEKSCEIIEKDDQCCEIIEKDDQCCESIEKEDILPKVTQPEGGVDREALGDDRKESSEEEDGDGDGGDGGGCFSDSSSDGPMSDEEVARMVDWLTEIESEAAEAQEHLEEEAVNKVESEVRLELSETLSGLELDMAVSREMADYVSEWKKALVELEEETARLQDRLEDAGVCLPDLYKAIEKQAPETCMTDTWRNRIHWAGTQAPEDFAEVLESAEKDLEAQRPVMRRRGKLVEEGASGFLERKVVETDPENGSRGWEILDGAAARKLNPGGLFDTERWAAVYSASTPEQAARLGLKFPGVDKVDDIADINHSVGMEALALAEESEFGLTEKQKKNLKRVREEDDVRQMQKRSSDRPVNYVVAMTSQIKSSTTDVDVPRHSAAVSSKLQPERSTEQPNQPSPQVKEDQQKKQTETRLQPECSPEQPNRPSPQQQLKKQIEVKQTVTGAREQTVHESACGEDEQKNRVTKAPAVEQSTDRHAVSVEHSSSGLKQAGQKEQGNDTHTDFKKSRELNDHSSVKDARPEVIVVSDDDDDYPPADCASTVHLRGVLHGRVQDKAVLDETTSPLKPRVVEFGSSSKNNKRKRGLVLDNSDGEEDAEAPEIHMHRDKPAETVRDTEERNTDSCDASLSKQSGDSRKEMKRKNRTFECTVCSKSLTAKNVLSHPALQVIVCISCKQQYDDGPFRKEEDGSEAECRWCGEGGNLICCDNCEKVFCEACINRNSGSAFLQTIEDIHWHCYLCDPSQLLNLQQLLKEAEEEAAATELQDNLDIKFFRRKKRKLRKMIMEDEATKEKLALEKDRRERLEKWYAAAAKEKSLYRKSARSDKAAEETDTEHHICEGDCKVEGCVINIASRGTDEPLVRIPLSISKRLKAHQLSGVRFMWENCIQSVEKANSKAEELGCILAHSMGLGKTLQVIAFLYTVMRNVHLNFKTALVVVPVNVLHNWQRELEKWRPAEVPPLEVYMLDAQRDNATRASVLKFWKENGGVMLIGYAAFRNLSTGCHVKDKETRDTLCECLQNPGPDLLVCDEAHSIKNDKADITIALQQVKTGRRIALTGSPLQNNLMEYYCMVDFVRRGFLGPPNHFRIKFQTPIAEGQHADSCSTDVRAMKSRAHILHKRLSGFVQRRDMTVLKNELPPKCVWVISVRLSALQKELYRKFLDVSATQKNRLFEHYHVLAKIWNHPDLLAIAREERKNNEFIVYSDKNESDEKEPGNTKRPSPEADIYEWCSDILENSKRDVLTNSGKLTLVMTLLSLSSSRGDKTLIFSQSLHTLDLIEKFLRSLPLPSSTGVWIKGRDWLRIDGNTSAGRRQQIADIFNDSGNTTIKCLLISTKAGSLGMNMTGANRVIIVDGSWNPTHDLQALFRAWRYGQTKPVFVYRLLAYGTMEEKIYNRQLTKEGIAARVLDAHQVGRHLNADDLELLYTLDDEDEDVDGNERNKEAEKEQQQDPGSKIQKSKHKSFCVPTDAPPRDDHMALLLLEHRPQWIAQYHEHEPLLEDLEDEKLTPEEMKMAWDGFIREHDQAQQEPNLVPSNSLQVRYTPPAGPSSGARTVISCADSAHADILRKLSVPAGGSVICGTCLQMVRWETLQGRLQSPPPPPPAAATT